jgi:polar amino acid transport system substrate-binding protein
MSRSLTCSKVSAYLKAHNYKALADIPDGTIVGLIIDYEYGDKFEQHEHRFKQIRVSSQEQIINMLKVGRLDSAILFDAVDSFTLKSMRLEPTDILKGPINHTSDIYVANMRNCYSIRPI